MTELDIFKTNVTATEYHLGLLKAKLAKYRAQLLEPSKSAGAKGEGFDVMKSGDARVALIGFPSVGKVSDTGLCCRVRVSSEIDPFITLMINQLQNEYTF